VLTGQMQLLLGRQYKRSSRYLQIADPAARRDGGALAMSGERLGGSNRGTRRFVSIAGLMQSSFVIAGLMQSSFVSAIS